MDTITIDDVRQGGWFKFVIIGGVFRFLPHTRLHRSYVASGEVADGAGEFRVNYHPDHGRWLSINDSSVPATILYRR